MVERSFNGMGLWWRHSYRQPKMGPFDYRVIALIFPFIFYIRIYTLVILAVGLTIIFFLQTKKIEPDNIVRWVRALFAGRHRTAQGVGRLREPIDFGFETNDDVQRESERLKKQREFRSSPKYKGKKIPKYKGKIGGNRLPLKERLGTTKPG